MAMGITKCDQILYSILLLSAVSLPGISLTKSIIDLLFEEENENVIKEQSQSTDAVNIYSIHVDSKSSPNEVDQRFLSIALDSSLVRAKWLSFNFSSAKLQNMAKALSPCYFRLGGTNEEFLIFNPDESLSKLGMKREKEKKTKNEICEEYELARKNLTNFTMTGEDFDKISNFAKDSGWYMLFGLNAFLRNVDGSWNTNNAIQLFEYVKQHDYRIGWELGNEPNRWIKFGKSKVVNGTQMGKDFRVLRQILNKNPKYGSLLFGPDVTRPHKSAIEFGKSFIAEADDVIDAFTWHQYYINSLVATLDNFTDPKLLELLREQINTVETYLNASHNSKSIWLGETGSASGGGAKGLSDTYVAGFLYLDKLGMAAQYGYKVVIRQSFYGGHYAMIDNALNPLPDFWSAVLHKTLVGRRVIKISGGDQYVRLYAHCSKTLDNDYKKGSVIVFGMNLHQSQNVELHFTEELSGKLVQQYLLTPSSGKLESTEISLNGNVLKLIDDLYVPDMYPQSTEQPLIMPPCTYAFYVIPDAGFAICT